MPKSEKLEAELSKIRKAAKLLGAEIYVDDGLSESSYIILNETSKKAIVIGTIGDKQDVEIVAFTLDVFKYKWAKAEGFSKEQVLGPELCSEIFSLLDEKDIIKYLLVDE